MSRRGFGVGCAGRGRLGTCAHTYAQKTPAPNAEESKPDPPQCGFAADTEPLPKNGFMVFILFLFLVFRRRATVHF